MKEVHRPKGNHFLVELQGCLSGIDKVEDHSELENCLKEIAKLSGATPLVFSHHSFQPNGITGTLILSESHISIHTYPDFKTIFIDIFTCGSCKPEASLDYIKDYFQPSFVSSRLIKRGLS